MANRLIKIMATAGKFIKGIHAEHTGKRLRALGELEVYLNQPVGVGEHSRISDEIENILKRIKEHDDIIAVIEEHFNMNEKEQVINE
jgi:hypothetical protein